jgi:hypothetical protein
LFFFQTVVTTYNTEAPRPVLMESNYGVTAVPRKEKLMNSSRLSSHALYEALPPPSQSSTAGGQLPQPQVQNFKMTLNSAQAATAAVARRQQHQQQSPRTSVVVGPDKAVNRLLNSSYPSASASVENLAAGPPPTTTKRQGSTSGQQHHELRSVYEDALMVDSKNDSDFATYKAYLYDHPGEENNPNQAAVEARRRLFYRDGSQPHSLLDLR